MAAMRQQNKPLIALKRLVKDSGTKAQAGATLGISPQYVCDMLQGRRTISARVAAKLGFKKVWEKL